MAKGMKNKQEYSFRILLGAVKSPVLKNGSLQMENSIGTLPLRSKKNFQKPIQKN